MTRTEFDNLVVTSGRKLYGHASRILGDKEGSEDAVQEVFIKIWESRKKIDAYLPFESFLFTLAYNSTISLLRKRLSESKSREYLKAAQQIEYASSAVSEFHYKELNEKAQSLLQQLTPRQKEIFVLSREDGLTHKEIGERLKISENTVKNHLVTTLKFLKSNIDPELITSALFFYLFF